jgi:hypothetical protein
MVGFFELFVMILDWQEGGKAEKEKVGGEKIQL